MPKRDDFVDPEFARWKRQYAKFPGVAKCIEILRRHNTRGGYLEAVCFELTQNAAANAQELFAAFRSEPDARTAHILLGVIVEARIPEALPLFVEQLQSNDDALRAWAIEGLRSLNTPAARKALFDAGLKKR